MIGRATSPVALLAFCGVASSATYLLAFTLPYGISEGLGKPLQHFGHISGGSPQATAGLISAIAGLFLLYLRAVRQCQLLEGSRTAWIIVYAGAAASALALLRMYPIFSLDIFYYMSADRIWSTYRENPFIVPPLQAAHDAFFPYNRWGHYVLPYGPLWPWLTAATSWFGGGVVEATLVAFKMFAILAFLVCLPLVAWTARALGHDRQLASLCIFAWNPLVLLEFAGGGHNDVVALVPVILALGLWLRGASAGALLSVTASLLVKATAIVLLPGLVWAGLRRAAQRGQLVRWTATHIIPTVCLVLVAWAPFGLNAVGSQLQESGQYYQSLTSLAAAAASTASTGGDSLPVRAVQAVLGLTFALAYFSQRNALVTEGAPALRSIWGITIFYFLVVTPFLSAWYMIWPTLYAAILAERRTTVLSAILGLGALGTYVVQFVLRPAWGLGAAEGGAVGLLVIGGPFLLSLAALNMSGRRLKPEAKPTPVAPVLASGPPAAGATSRPAMDIDLPGPT
ncbi:MAG: hypothetical protein HY534_06300 [Chloroflexi bacterium]|nr:hypothetical protein [Chloroflexota bacterium]